MALEHAGRTILEMLWEQAVIQYGIFRELDLDVDGDEVYYNQQGKLQGIAYSIAKIMNPAKPNVAHVKEQIKKQWKAEQ